MPLQLRKKSSSLSSLKLPYGSLLVWGIWAASALAVEEVSPSEGLPFVGLVTGDRVNLRALPNISSEVLYSLPRGAKLIVLEKRGAWWGVLLPADTPVFVHRGLLVMTSDEKATVRGSNVHVRAGAGRAFASLGTLQEKEEVQVRRLAGEWAQIVPPTSCRGWVSVDYVTYLEPV